MGSVIISEHSLLTMPGGWWPSSNGTPSLYSDTYPGFVMDYEALYRKQHNVKICVEFIAQNVAHLGLHIYTIDKNNDRVRERSHRAVQILKKPLANSNKVTQYKMIEAAVSDFMISGNGYLLKIRNAEGQLTGLMRIPYFLVTTFGMLIPSRYEINLGGEALKVEPNDIIHFRSYNPENNAFGVSPLEGLREVLAEEYENTRYTASFWRNAARIGGVIERPAEQAIWSEQARARFKSEWEALYSGEANSGKTAVLEEGMTFKQISFAPKDTLYIESRKLTREEVARAFHIPPPMVGILDRATFSNISEQNKSLYTQVLGPLCANFEGDWTVQYLSEFPDLVEKQAYCEFNISEKLQGDFVTQMGVLRAAVGVPFMTPNEARAIQNLPRIANSPMADHLVTPMNMMQPGTDNQTPNPAKTAVEAETKAPKDLVVPDFPEVYDQYISEWQKVLQRTFTRQKESVLPKTKAATDISFMWDQVRWNKELTEDFTKLTLETSEAFGVKWASRLGTSFDRLSTINYLKENARIAAEYINKSTYDQLMSALQEEDRDTALNRVFELAFAARVAQLAIERMTAIENYTEYKVAIEVRFKTKTWMVQSRHPRKEHEQMNGETVGIKEMFSNGLRWPGDYHGSAEDNANCQCKMGYGK